MRKACKLDELEFLNMFIKEIGNYENNIHNLYLNNDIIFKDLSKVDFEWENRSDIIDCFESQYVDGGYLHFYLGWAGSDWESPVYYILYFDKNKKLRGYIPKRGNTYNLKSKKAAIDDDWDEREFDKQLLIIDIGDRIQIC